MGWLKILKYELYKKKMVHEAMKKSCAVEMKPMSEPIDFVVTWVDGSDPKWLKEKYAYQNKENAPYELKDSGVERYREWDMFRYWFRAVEKYAPWVRNIYFVTWGHVPSWLNINAPKLKIITHAEYMPSAYLPTFNSVPIGLNLFRIEGLSEHFVYFNDDVFLNRPVLPEDFFAEGKPNYTAVAKPLINRANDVYEHIQFSTLGAVNHHFRDNISRKIGQHPEKWFAKVYGRYYLDWNIHAYDKNYLPGMLAPHLGLSLKKSMVCKVWDDIPNILHETCLHRFRTSNDVMSQVYTIWAMLEGDFNPVSKEFHGRVFSGNPQEVRKAVDAILDQKYRMICINDSELVSHGEYIALAGEICGAFEKVFPDKSQYEK